MPAPNPLVDIDGNVLNTSAVNQAGQVAMLDPLGFHPEQVGFRGEAEEFLNLCHEFDGVAGGLELADTSYDYSAIAGGFSFDFTVIFDDFGASANSTLIAQNDGTGSTGRSWLLVANNDGNKWRTLIGGTIVDFDSTHAAAEAGVVYHGTLSYDGATSATLTINGVSETKTLAAKMEAANGEIWIGSNKGSANSGTYLDGKLRIFNTRLGTVNVSGSFNFPRVRRCTPNIDAFPHSSGVFTCATDGTNGLASFGSGGAQDEGAAEWYYLNHDRSQILDQFTGSSGTLTAPALINSAADMNDETFKGYLAYLMQTDSGERFSEIHTIAPTGTPFTDGIVPVTPPPKDNGTTGFRNTSHANPAGIHLQVQWYTTSGSTSHAEISFRYSMQREDWRIWLLKPYALSRKVTIGGTVQSSEPQRDGKTMHAVSGGQSFAVDVRAVFKVHKEHSSGGYLVLSDSFSGTVPA